MYCTNYWQRLTTILLALFVVILIKMLKKNCFVSISVIITVFMFLTSVVTVFGEEILLTWDQNEEEELAGYNVYYGNESGVYFDDSFIQNIAISLL